jgi:TrmH family RNA methyltransferase
MLRAELCLPLRPDSATTDVSVVLTSTRSPHVARLRRLHERKGRQHSGTFLAEGPDCVSAAISVGWVKQVFAIPGHEVSALAMQQGIDVIEAEDRVISAMTDTQSSQGIVAECALPDISLSQVLQGSGPVVVCDQLADPGNLGTIVRTAEAVAAAGVLVTHGSVDPWNPKVVRSSAGSIFRMPVVTVSSALEAVQALREAGWLTVGLGADAAMTVTEIHDQQMTGGGSDIAWVVGSEAHGVSEQAWRAVALQARIPMSPAVESLNAAISVAVSLYICASGTLRGDLSPSDTPAR